MADWGVRLRPCTSIAEVLQSCSALKSFAGLHWSQALPQPCRQDGRPYAIKDLAAGSAPCPWFADLTGA